VGHADVAFFCSAPNTRGERPRPCGDRFSANVLNPIGTLDATDHARPAMSGSKGIVDTVSSFPVDTICSFDRRSDFSFGNPSECPNAPRKAAACIRFVNRIVDRRRPNTINGDCIADCADLIVLWLRQYERIHRQRLSARRKLSRIPPRAAPEPPDRTVFRVVAESWTSSIITEHATQNLVV